jgi:hypothetical protein
MVGVRQLEQDAEVETGRPGSDDGDAHGQATLARPSPKDTSRVSSTR